MAAPFDVRGGALPLPSAMEAPPLLVRVLGGNVVTTAAVLACLNTADATVVRRLHPALAAAVAAVPWADTATPVHDTTRWRAALPAATAMKLAEKARLPLRRGRMSAAPRRVTALDLARCDSITDAVIAHLPPTLRTLNVSDCRNVTQNASFAHLSALEALDCSRTGVVQEGLARLPPSLRELRLAGCELPGTANFSHLQHLREVTHTYVQRPLSAATVASLPPSLEVLDISLEYACDIPWPRGWSLAHLTRLRVLNASCSDIDGAAIAAMPSSLNELNLAGCGIRSLVVSFAHLICLHALNLSRTPISSAVLASLPPSLVSLDLSNRCHIDNIGTGGAGTMMLTAATVFPYLPALRVLKMSYTSLGDAAIASLPTRLEELSMVGCRNVTPRARLDHLRALRVLQSAGTDLSPTTIATCRARGCVAPADGMLACKEGGLVGQLVPLPDGRLVCGGGRCVRLWEVAAGHNELVAELELAGLFCVEALAVLRDGHRVAVGMSCIHGVCPGVVVWDTRKAPHSKRVVTSATIPCASDVQALVVAANGHLVAGCADGKLCVVDVDAGAVMATLAAHDPGNALWAAAVLLDGRVATAAGSGELKLWDLSTLTCVLTLAEHTITSIAVLPDGRLASGSHDGTVRLWDTGRGTCTRVLTGHTSWVRALAVLPGGRLASLSNDDTIRVWDVRNDAGGAGGALLAQPPPTLSFGNLKFHSLLPLPGNRLATGGGGGCVYLWPLPPCGA